MWLMLQQEKPNDYVLATKKTYSVRGSRRAFKFSYEITWEGSDKMKLKDQNGVVRFN